MKIFVSTGLLVVIVAVAMRLPGIAEPPAGEVEAAPQPLAPELWNVFESIVDDVRVTVRPVACPIEAGMGRLCAELTGVNLTDELKDMTFQVSLLSTNDPGISRMPVPPELVQMVPGRLQVPAGGTGTNIIAFTPPDPLPMSLTMNLTTEADPTGGISMAYLWTGAAVSGTDTDTDALIYF